MYATHSTCVSHIWDSQKSPINCTNVKKFLLMLPLRAEGWGNALCGKEHSVGKGVHVLGLASDGQYIVCTVWYGAAVYGKPVNLQIFVNRPWTCCCRFLRNFALGA